MRIIVVCVLLVMLTSCFSLNPLNWFKPDKPSDEITVIVDEAGNISKVDYRQVSDIKQVFKNTWTMSWTWLMDIFKIVLLVCVLTELLKFKYPIPKPFMSALVTIVLCIIGKFITGGDTLYFVILAGLGWFLANGGWHILMTLFRGQKVLDFGVGQSKGVVRRLLGKTMPPRASE